MSTPANPLANYRSYSYYHVLALCDSTQTAASLAQLTEEDAWRHATKDTVSIDEYATYGKYAPKTIQVSDSSNITGKYCVLIDGSSDADFSIVSANWVAVTTGVVTPNDRGTSIALEGSVTVSEPKGVVFADTIVNICRSLNVQSGQAMFVLKTFFVGHVYSTVTEYDEPGAITNIDPYVFTVIDLKGSFTEKGGEYQLLTVGQQHGAARLPQYSRAAAAISINPGLNLKTTIEDKLAEGINRNSTHMFNCVEAALQGGSMDPAQLKNIKSRLTNVKYVFKLDPVYHDPSYVVTCAPLAQNEPSCEPHGPIVFTSDYHIEDAIHDIMSRCPKVRQEASNPDDRSGARTGPTRYTYKIHSHLESSRDPCTFDQYGAPKMEYIVTFEVVRYPEPTSFNLFAALQDNDTDMKTIADNTITFDYVYTGKNVDILDFNINMSMGLVYLQAATSTNSTRDSLNPYPTRVTSPPTNAYVPNDNSPIPVHFSSSISSHMFRNTGSPSEGIQTAYTLSKHSSLESLETSIRIYGNPLLLNTVNRASRSAANGTTTGVGNTTLVDFTRHPSFAKINIKMPRTNDDLALFNAATDASVGAEDFTKDFWYQGYYYIYAITNNFENGEFYQVLNMLGMPSKIDFNSASKNDQIAIDFGTRVNQCYDRLVGAAADATEPTLTQAPTSGTKKGSGASGTWDAPVTATPTTPNDINSMLKSPSGRSLDNVEGYSNASRDVQDAIISATTSSRVKAIDSVMLARIAAAESSLGRNNTNPLSRASGLFQFIPKTWTQLVRENKIPGIPPSEAGTPESLSKRYDNKYAALAEVAMLSDEAVDMTNAGFEVNDLNMYMVHHFGGPRARQILKAAARGETNLSNVLTQNTIDTIKMQNPAMKNVQSPQDVIDYAAGRIASTVKNGITVTQPNTSALTPKQRAAGLSPRGTPPKKIKTAEAAVRQAAAGNAHKPAKETKPCGDTPAGVDKKKQYGRGA